MIPCLVFVRVQPLFSVYLQKERVDTFFWNSPVSSSIKILLAVFQFLTVGRQKDMTTLNDALQQRFIMKKTETTKELLSSS
jgi:hypothetical protein